MKKILIVDDEASICWALRSFLQEEGHMVRVASSAEEGLQMASQDAPDALVLDVRLPGMDGLAAMSNFRVCVGDAPIIVMTAFGNLETAVKAMEGGAFDYIAKPFDLDAAAAIIQRALQASQTPPQATATALPALDALLGTSAPMQEIFKRIAMVAATDVPVLITGESGTGKELVARAIHRHSTRAKGPFIPVCLPALSAGVVESELFGHVRGAFTGASHDRQGIFELASGGTVFLDEIADSPLAIQIKLLRALEHREVTPVGDARPRLVNSRIVAATNRSLGSLMAEGQFREDLFFRLSGFPIALPPLRERVEDIPLLARHFLQRVVGRDREACFTPEFAAALCQRAWPGNVRELRNAVEHAAILARGGHLRPEHLPPAAPISTPTLDPVAQVRASVYQWVNNTSLEVNNLHEQLLGIIEPPLFLTVLERLQQNRAAAAQCLGLHRATLRQKLRNYGM